MTADGSAMKSSHAAGAGNGAAEAALATRLAWPGQSNAGGHSAREPGLDLDQRAVAARDDIRATLVALVRVIAEGRGITLPWTWAIEQLPAGFIGPPRLVRRGDNTAVGMARYLHRHASWLAAHREHPLDTIVNTVDTDEAPERRSRSGGLTTALMHHCRQKRGLHEREIGQIIAPN